MYRHTGLLIVHNAVWAEIGFISYQVTQDVKILQKENSSLKEDIKALRSENQGLQQQLEESCEENQAMKNQVRILTEDSAL